MGGIGLFNNGNVVALTDNNFNNSSEILIKNLRGNYLII